MSDSILDRYPLFQRPPAVSITYDIGLDNSKKEVAIPLIIGVIADFSGQQGSPQPPIEKRRFIDANIENFDSLVSELKPRLEFKVRNVVNPGCDGMHIELTFKKLSDFLPTELARQIGPLRKLLEARTKLSNLVIYMHGKKGAETLIAELLNDRKLMESLQFTPIPLGRYDGQSFRDNRIVSNQYFFQRLSDEFKYKSKRGKSEVEFAIRTLAMTVLEKELQLGKEIPKIFIEGLIDEIDCMLTNQLNLILHHHEFQALESAWRGLYYLAKNVESGQKLKIRAMAVAKNELAAMFRRYQGGAWDQSPLYQKLSEEPFGRPDGEPFGAVVGDYFFDHEEDDVLILNGMAKIASSAHFNFITGVKPTIFQMDSWDELSKPRDLKRLTSTPEYAAWNALRESKASRSIAVTMPRFLARLPYGSENNPVPELSFEEDPVCVDSQKFIWINSAYAIAVNLGRAFRYFGWCARISGYETGGAIENLPVFSQSDSQGGVELVCPVDVNISDRREAELAKIGVACLVHRKGSDFAAFMGVPSFHKPPEDESPESLEIARWSTNLAFLNTANQFLRSLRCLIRDSISQYSQMEDFENMLNNWLSAYVEPKMRVSPVARALRPLLGAEVRLVSVDANRLRMEIYLSPYYQLEQFNSHTPIAIKTSHEFVSASCLE